MKMKPFLWSATAENDCMVKSLIGRGWGEIRIAGDDKTSEHPLTHQKNSNTTFI